MNEIADAAHTWHKGYRQLQLQLYMFVIVFAYVVVETTNMMFFVLDLAKRVGTGVEWVQ